MAKQLFVGSLAWGTTSEALQAHFATIGEVEKAQVITDRDTGRSRGFGFVSYVNDDDADKAIAELNGSDLDGRQITVNEAKPREERPRREFNNDRGGSQGGGSFRQRSW